MADLISRAAAIAEVEEYLQGLDSCISEPDLKLDGYRNGLQVAIQEIKAIPAVDAVPVVHARWTTERTWKHDGEWYCSACEYEPIVFMDSSYCPNCGAKMDGERRENE